MGLDYSSPGISFDLKNGRIFVSGHRNVHCVFSGLIIQSHIYRHDSKPGWHRHPRILFFTVGFSDVNPVPIGSQRESMVRFS